jgi:hypothetical protein
MSARTSLLSWRVGVLPCPGGVPGGLDRMVLLAGGSRLEAEPSLDPVPQEEANKVRTSPRNWVRLPFETISPQSLPPAGYQPVTGL